MKCKKCGSESVKKDGVLIRTNHKRQQYKCKDCGYSWSVKIEVPMIEGITAEDRVDLNDEIIPYLIKVGQRAKEKNIAELKQTITMPDEPFALVLMADLHAGGKTDYEALCKDVELIGSTPGMYVGNVGDNFDNFIIGTLQSIQREQPTTHEMEVRFVRWLMKQLSNHLLFWCSGNHDNWSNKVSGIDFMREGLRGTHCLYDNAQIFFNLKWGNNEQKWLVRHKWRGTSIFNATHGIETGWERVGLNFDVGVAAHTHIATLCRTFIKGNQKRFAILLGTYKVRDQYARDCGYARSVGLGSGAFVYHPDGRVFWSEDLETAKSLLKTWQNEYKHESTLLYM